MAFRQDRKREPREPRKPREKVCRQATTRGSVPSRDLAEVGTTLQPQSPVNFRTKLKKQPNIGIGTAQCRYLISLTAKGFGRQNLRR
jgi:hypothetical protein